ncbi:ribosomal subunit interface protein [Devosia enhydra]|uniref:Ribosome hibernation promoting factor n=1 Tax=Devosia enhydra TaxID=665118 RepID=A0A1K2I2C3_9HYPH|nr:ribosome-associated translation inhibitor RaiA [Devosia enhydra]SFZ86533.1 ribosomal subunit interface protein [Devosia enhydra]
MTVRVSGKNMDVGDALRSKAEEHIDAVVTKYFDGGYSGHLTLEPEGSGYNAQSVVHLDSGAVLRASAYGADPTLAYEIMANAIEKRLRRYNRKLKSHHRGTGQADVVAAQSYVLAASSDDEELDEDYAPPVIAEATSNLRQMSVGEAVMELDLTQSEMVMFRHAGHGGLNVVYRRADGNIGWIDPALRAN